MFDCKIVFCVNEKPHLEQRVVTRQCPCVLFVDVNVCSIFVNPCLSAQNGHAEHDPVLYLGVILLADVLVVSTAFDI